MGWVILSSGISGRFRVVFDSYLFFEFSLGWVILSANVSAQWLLVSYCIRFLSVFLFEFSLDWVILSSNISGQKVLRKPVRTASKLVTLKF